MSSATSTLIFSSRLGCWLNLIKSWRKSFGGSNSGRIFSKSRVNLNSEPLPLTLFIPILPPCNSISCFTMASPRPEPPYFLEVSRPACSNILKIYSCLFFGIPIPVSSSLNSILIFSVSSCTFRVINVILPCSVNFTALLSRFIITWRSRSASPAIIWGIVLSKLVISKRFFSRTVFSNNFTMDNKDSSRLKAFLSKVIFPAFTLERSRISLINTSKASPDILIALI